MIKMLYFETLADEDPQNLPDDEHGQEGERQEAEDGAKNCKKKSLISR